MRRLAADYPLAVGRGRRWQRHAIELANGVVIEAWSTGQRIRGRRRGEHRPTLIVCDDLQNDSHISSAAQRDAVAPLVPWHAAQGGHEADECHQPGHGPAPRRAGDGAAHGRRLAVGPVCGDCQLADEHRTCGTNGRAFIADMRIADCGLEGTAANPQSEIRNPKSDDAARAFLTIAPRRDGRRGRRAVARGRGPVHADEDAGRERPHGV